MVITLPSFLHFSTKNCVKISYSLHHICFRSLVLVLLALLALTQMGDSHLTSELLTKTGFFTSDGELRKWAVLIAGSKGFSNYRHQADVCHAYQLLKNRGLSDENIIVFMHDDIAWSQENPTPGIIVNNPSGIDVYRGVPKDYTGENLTSHNIFAAILGNKDDIQGGSGKVVDSRFEDNIFIYFSGHGDVGILQLPGYQDRLNSSSLIKTLEQKFRSGTYDSMVIYLESCKSGSLFDGLLGRYWAIYATTASNPYEDSKAAYCPLVSDPYPEYETCLGDRYSAAWMEDIEMHSTLGETLQEQYQKVKDRTLNGWLTSGSHVMEYGDFDISKNGLSQFFGSAPPFVYDIHHKNQSLSSSMNNTVDQHEATILYLKLKVLRAPEGSIKKKEAQMALDAELSHRERINHTFQEIVKVLVGDEKVHGIIHTLQSDGQPVVDDWDCFDKLVETFETHCGVLSTYGLKYMRVFANLCNARINQSQLAKVASQVCGKIFN